MNKEKIEQLQKEIKELEQQEELAKNSVEPTQSFFKVGEKYLIRTVTMALVGRLKCVNPQELLLESASWIADTGRFSECLRSGVESMGNSEIEPFKNDVIVGRGSLIDATIYDNDINLKQK